MAEIDHYHPVLKSEELGKKPVLVRVAGREIVVFRAASGALGALDERCPHRGMRLSLGAVEGEELVCRYHGWRWRNDGSGLVPATPAARPCTEPYDVVERLGAIWIKRQGSTATFPRFDVAGHSPVGRFRHTAAAPIELVLDNFIEVEHTPTTHALLGYPIDRMDEVETKTILTDDAVRVHNIGPQRRLPAPIYPLFGITPELWFVDDWTTYFSPLYTVYDQYWVDPTSREQVSEALRIAVFFNPLGPSETEIFTFVYTQASLVDRFGLNLILFAMVRAFVDLEVRRDCAMLRGLADGRTGLEGSALGRFDKALGACRKRIERIYRGKPEGSRPLVTAG
jgi:phenylpropionate dioxygenase-like ring-hydroxylating dioxygenase large terminal subunit